MTAAQADSAALKVAAKGRSVTFIKLETTPADSDKPWRGAADPRTTPADSLSTSAVFVPLSSASNLGLSTKSEELVKRTRQVAIVALGSESTEDLEDYQELIDSDGSRWRITFIETLKPADVRIMHFVGVGR